MGVEYDFDEYRTEGARYVLMLVGLVLIGCAGLVWAIAQHGTPRVAPPTVNAVCAP